MTPADKTDDDPHATLTLHGAADCGAAALRLLEGARRRVRILPQRVDLRYLTDDAVVAALRALLVGSRRARLEMLLPPELARPRWGDRAAVRHAP